MLSGRQQAEDRGMREPGCAVRQAIVRLGGFGLPGRHFGDFDLDPQLDFSEQGVKAGLD